ncbi:MAG: hypothetical protein HQ582_03220 [Planctomycetes bacterium]|nr:hypothetical protein [Planctomycetota bacterium]
MSRRKKSSDRRHAPTPPERNDKATSNRSSPEPNPPRPSKPFLWAATILLAGWIAFLVFLAVTS